ncbi:MAG: hypothetical protein HY695_24470 [Deltaproteobacteria bacterium]|nr:hypothetical protein [Deltaproteobacteria bacterium]
MKRAKFCALILFLVASLTLGVSVVPPSVPAQVIYSCFPTCSETDARFLSLVGQGLFSLAGTEISLVVTAPAGATFLELGIFDGNTGGMWDRGGAELEYTLYADPLGDGSGSAMVGHWFGNTSNPLSGSGPGGAWIASSANMPDNGWWTLTVAPSLTAMASDGSYKYNLRIRMTDITAKTESNFKLRALSPGVIAIGPQTVVVAVMAAIYTIPEAQIVYPSLDPLTCFTSNPPASCFTPTTYDGSWNFYFNVPAPQSSMAVWDGDFDYGAYDCSTNDTDDPDTSNDTLPLWAVGTSAVYEGVAGGPHSSGSCTPTGRPQDDSPFPIFRRSPSVQYKLIDPNGISYVNNDPSGTEEWEQFRVRTALDLDPADYQASSLPAGIYRLQVDGLDLRNLVALNFQQPIVGERCNETHCGPQPPPPPPGLPPTEGPGSGTGTPGYWANHRDAWPVNSIIVGPYLYTRDEAINLIKKATKKDVTYIMAQAFIAAVLNVSDNNDDSCIQETIDAADLWLFANPPGSRVPGGGANSPWRIGEPLYKLLDDYNNGRLCAPHRD